MKATTVLWTKQTVRLQPQMILSKSWCPGQNRLEINAEPRTEAEELNAKEEKRLPSTKLFPAINFGRSRFKSQLYQLYIYARPPRLIISKSSEENLYFHFIISGNTFAFIISVSNCEILPEITWEELHQVHPVPVLNWKQFWRSQSDKRRRQRNSNVKTNKNAA